MAQPRQPGTVIGRAFSKFARVATEWTGSSMAFFVALLTILVWAATGPMCGFSDTWQLVINTGTTIVTFLMVFLIQRSQNRDSVAVQLKLDELIAAVKGASNRMIAVEELSEEEINRLREHFKELAELAKGDLKPGVCHSVEELAEVVASAKEAVEDAKEVVAKAGKS